MRGSRRSMTPQRLFTLRHLSQLLTTLRLKVETLQRPAPPVMLRRTRVSNPRVQTGEPNRTGGQSERVKTDLNDFKEFLVGSIVTGKDWAMWACGLGSSIWRGACAYSVPVWCLINVDNCIGCRAARPVR